jgi:hypothetical protein
LICDKIKGGVLFIVKKKGRRRRDRGGREEGRSLGHILNITNEFTNKFHQLVNSIDNYVCKNDTSSNFLVFFLFLLFLPINILYRFDISNE